MTQVCASVRWHLFCDASSDNGNALIALSVYVWCQLSYIVLLRYTYFGENIYFVFLLLFIKGVNASLPFFFSPPFYFPPSHPTNTHTHTHTVPSELLPYSGKSNKLTILANQAEPGVHEPEMRP